MAPSRTIVSLFFTCICLVGTTFGQSCYQATADSQLRVSGSATVRSFSCVSNTIQGRAVMKQPSEDSVTVALQVPVRSFECGKRAMNEDLYEALKADEHPYIQYRVGHADIISGDQTGDRDIRIIGALTMAGTTNRDTTVVKGRPAADQRFHIQGSTDLSLQRFQVEPPTALFGLIQVQDSVTVSVDLLGTTCSSSG